MSRHIFVVGERATWAPVKEDRDYYAPGSIGNIPCEVEEIERTRPIAWIRLDNGKRVGVAISELRIAK